MEDELPRPKGPEFKQPNKDIVDPQVSQMDGLHHRAAEFMLHKSADRKTRREIYNLEKRIQAGEIAKKRLDLLKQSTEQRSYSTPERAQINRYEDTEGSGNSLSREQKEYESEQNNVGNMTTSNERFPTQLSPENLQSKPEQLNPEDTPIEPEHHEPLEREYELRHEVKDTPRTHAVPVGDLLPSLDKLQQSQTNSPGTVDSSNVATTLQNIRGASTNAYKRSGLYATSVKTGFWAGLVLIILAVTFISLR